ncbi:hypothetical protein AVEN_49786-1 [Araneus ventricosus]|uniref:Uncharacterized protein n=1 Tax=Araneus ventricosus TaxID=182803 RepID=A0A4Y2FRP6_ARAVE|nr:hypothetical protein AVEN_192533-1 [Araneus ventricosus]GBM42778.1 hypothetical protein AVEN_3874-1 [Araneus ventricosus]GBM43687.1 hypothetical protein AVEN_49786-1 [Araneus ventricosus]
MSSEFLNGVLLTTVSPPPGGTTSTQMRSRRLNLTVEKRVKLDVTSVGTLHRKELEDFLSSPIVNALKLNYIPCVPLRIILYLFCRFEAFKYSSSGSERTNLNVSVFHRSSSLIKFDVRISRNILSKLKSIENSLKEQC